MLLAKPDTVCMNVTKILGSKDSMELTKTLVSRDGMERTRILG